MKLQPEELQNWGDEFLLSLVYQLENADIPIHESIKKQLPKLTKPETNPIKVMKNAYSYSERQCKDEQIWKARVNNFLCWVIEYKCIGFSWKNLIFAVKEETCPNVIRENLTNVINELIHLKKCNGSSSSSSTTLNSTFEQKISEKNFISNPFCYNERFVFILIENHYFRYFLNDDNLYNYYGILLKSFLINANLEETFVPICKEISWFALSDDGCNLLLKENIIFDLFKLFKSDNELVIISCSTALVNILSNNRKAKQNLIDLGIFPIILQRFLKNSSRFSIDLLRVLLKLLRTCIDNDNSQLIVTKENGLTILASLLDNHFFASNDELFIDICSTIWRTINDGNRPLLCTSNCVKIICNRIFTSIGNLELLRVSLVHLFLYVVKMK